MERILVTGGAGYVGCILVPTLLEKGYRVTIYDSLIYGAHPLLHFSFHPRLNIIKGDIRDTSMIASEVKKHDIVIHLAAIVGYPACASDEVRARTTNVGGTKNILDAMGKSQRIIFASTGSTYGKVEGVATEETPIAPLTLYGSTKRDGENSVRESGVPNVILRFATVYGSSPRMRLDLLINDFMYQALHNKQIVMFEGHFRRTFLHSRDAAAVYPFTLDNFDTMAGNVYNVGDESMNYTKKEIALKIKEYVDYYLHEGDTGSDPDMRDYEVDYRRIKSLGYRSQVTLDEGLRELLKILSVLTVSNPYRNA